MVYAGFDLADSKMSWEVVISAVHLGELAALVGLSESVGRWARRQ